MSKVRNLLDLVEGAYLPYSPLSTTADAGMTVGIGEDTVIEEIIEKEGSHWVLKSKKTGKVLGKHKTKGDARAQEQAIEISKHSK